MAAGEGEVMVDAQRQGEIQQARGGRGGEEFGGRLTVKERAGLLSDLGIEGGRTEAWQFSGVGSA